jgi:hypothetical protein
MFSSLPTVDREENFEEDVLSRADTVKPDLL